MNFLYLKITRARKVTEHFYFFPFFWFYPILPWIINNYVPQMCSKREPIIAILGVASKFCLLLCQVETINKQRIDRYIYLSIHLSVYRSTCQSTYLSIYLYIYRSIYLSIIYLSFIDLSIYITLPPRESNNFARRTTTFSQ